MKHNLLTILMVLTVMIFVTGCSGDANDYAETTITVEKKGRITERIVDSFDKDYYNIEELKAEFSDSVNKYNESIGGEEIKLKKIELKNSRVYVDLVFNGPSDYENFVGEKLFVGTIKDAYDNGYTMDVVLKGVDRGDKIDKIKLMGMSDRNIIILSEHSRIKTFRDIAYVSANVDVIDGDEARILNESDGLAYIVLK